MNEGGPNLPQDELEGSEETPGEAETSLSVSRPSASKRRPVHSRRMQEYLQQQDKTLPQKLRKCTHPGCEKLFSSAPGLRYHLLTHSPDTRQFCCDRCRKEFKSHNGLKYHQQRTKCLVSPVEVSMVKSAQQQHSPPHVFPSPPFVEFEERSLSAVASRRSSLEKDETDSIHEPSIGPVIPDWPEPRHRKMESRRKQMEHQHQLRLQAQSVEAESRQQQARLLIPSCQPQKPEPMGSEATERLLQFANIATGPQSPLLMPQPIDWDRVSLPVESDAGVLRSSSPPSSSPSESFCILSHWSPNALWQCFMKGTRICLAGEDASLPWIPVENFTVACVQGQNLALPEDLKQPIPLRLISQQKSAEDNIEVELGFESQSRHQSRLTACCVNHHPFFVRNKGWASCNAGKTKELYGLSSSTLEIDDICLPPACCQQSPRTRHSEGPEVNTLEQSSVVALSKMAQKRSQESSDRQQTPVSANQQQTPKAKRPMNAFLLWSQTMRHEFIKRFPRINNRDISSLLSKEWYKLSDSERRKLQTEARMKAELQKKQHPDCWKRKQHR